MADAKKLTIEIEVTADGAIKSIKNLDRAVQEASKQADNADKSFSSFQASIVTLNQATDFASKVFNGFASVMGFVGQQLERAGRIEGLTTAFDQFQQKVGRDAVSALNSLRDATGGVVSDLQLIELGTTSAALGIDQGTEAYFRLTNAVAKASKALGKDFSEGVAVVNQGIGRLSPQVLDNLAVTLKAGDVYERFAATLHKSSEELSTQEQRQAILGETLKQLEEKFGATSLEAQTAADAFRGLLATVDNAQNAFATAISQNEGLRDAIDALSDAIKDVNWGEFARGVADIITLVIRAAEQIGRLVAVISELPQNIRDIADQSTLNSFSQFNAETQKLAGQFIILANRTKVSEEGFEKLKKTYSELQAKFNQQTGGNPFLAPGAAQALNEFNESLHEYESQLKALPPVLERAGDAQGELTGKTKEAEDAAKKAAEAWERLQDALKVGSGQGGIPEAANAISNLKTQLETGERTIQEYNGALLSLAEYYKSAGYSAEDFSNQLQITDDQIKEVNKSLDRLFNSQTGQDLFGGADVSGTGNFLSDSFSETLGEEIGAAIENGLADALSIALNGGNSGDYRNAVGKLGGDLGSYFGPIGEVLGSNLATSVFDGFNHAFGGDRDPQANARDAFYGFLRDVFDAQNAQVIIDGELTKLSSLFDFDRSFFDNGEGFNVFNSLGEQAREAFQGVGVALGQIFQDEFPDLPIGQVAGIFADALDGDIFALKGAFDALGISIQDAEEAIVQAGKEGKVSFLEAQSALQGLGTIAEDGVPGQLGAVKVALDAIREAGVFGGAASVQAFKALGVELEELNVTTLPGAEKKLLELGYSAQDVASIMEAFGAAGITSIDQVSDASDRLSFAFLANLQAQGDFFDEAQEKAQDLIDKLTALPDEQRTKVIVEVETIARDQGAQGFIDSGFGEGLRT